MLVQLGGIPVLTVHNKIDLTDEEPRISADGLELWISARTAQGIDLLRGRLLQLAGWQAAGEGSFIARARHVCALRRTSAHLEAAATCGKQLEFLAEELRLAQASLSEITGEFSADDLLGVIFSEFCIGK